MKLVPIFELPTLKTVDIIKAVMEQPGQPAPGQPGGLGVSEVLERTRVLKALRKSVTPAGLVLEDGDHTILVNALKSFRFGLASEDLEQVLQGIIDAKEPPAASNLVPDTPA